MKDFNRRTLERKTLVELAVSARKTAYCPYSGFAVGAALLCADGTVYTGGNIENAAYGPANCAERTAFFKAISEGKRSFLAIAVAGAPADREPETYCAPCGVCRQVMREFCRDDFEILLVGAETVRVYTLAELLPESFSPQNLKP